MGRAGHKTAGVEEDTAEEDMTAAGAEHMCSGGRAKSTEVG
jgi:hypothetical protein